MNASLSVDGPRPLSMLRMDMVICCSMSAESLDPVCATCCCRAILKICAEERYLPRFKLDAMAWTNSAVIGRGGNFHDVARRVQRFHLESRGLCWHIDPSLDSGWPPAVLLVLPLPTPQ